MAFERNDAVWELAGYVLWLIGSALFAIVSYRNDDTLSFIGSLLFFFGIVTVMVPMVRAYRQSRERSRELDTRRKAS